MRIITTEKAIRMIEAENKLIFEFERNTKKEAIKKQIESLFNVKVDSINLMVRKNKKIAVIKLDKKNPAIDVATKLGVI